MGECKNRSWAWLAALGVMVACACLPAVAAEPLKVGYFDLPPHTTAGLSAGQDAAAKDYFRRVAERMGVAEVEFSQYPLPRLLLMLEQGRLDLALILAKTPEREAKLVYPGTPLFSTASVLAVRSNNPLSAVTGSEDLIPLNIGVWQGGYHSTLLSDPSLRLTTLSGDHVVNKGLGMLLAGRVDGFYFPDAYALRFEVLKQHLQSNIKILPMPEPALALYSAFSRPAADTYLARYEQALREVQAEISYEQFFTTRLAP